MSVLGGLIIFGYLAVVVYNAAMFAKAATAKNMENMIWYGICLLAALIVGGIGG